MADCGCTHEAPCVCSGCQEKDALIRILYAKIAEIEKALNDSAGLNAAATRH